MDRRSEANTPETVDTRPSGEDNPLVEETSGEYLARWDRLVSTTNWEKGRIICEWREALIAAGAPPGGYSDEAWSRRAGGVSPQHAGRLRKVFQRFGQVHQGYAGLYWSHFQAAADWPDAEMWLEGAVQSRWPVARMRHERWQAIGAPPGKKPRDEEVITSELDEDFSPADEDAVPRVISDSLGVVQEAQPLARHEPGDAPQEADKSDASPPSGSPAVEPFHPFENFAPLPPDLNKAYEAFRRAISRHKRAGWRRISLGDVLVVLDALKQLAMEPAED
ncbi:MAG: hypothetical protein ACYSWU_07855 [Planctomycetota bacterium]|jgi:hypothetical protein